MIVLGLNICQITHMFAGWVGDIVGITVSMGTSAATAGT
jgi:hypothetical protein